MDLRLAGHRILGVTLLLTLGIGCGSTGPTPDGGIKPDAGPDAGGQPITSGDPVGLWVDGLYAYSSTQLGTSGSPTPDDVCPIQSGASTNPSAFDASGNLWVQGTDGSTVFLLMWSPADLQAACSSGVPSRTVTLVDLPDQISAFAFDSSGTIWMSFEDKALLLGYSASQIAQTSSPSAPAYSITYGAPYAAGLHAPQGLAFDSGGALWVANEWSVLKYNAGTLAASTLGSNSSGGPAPDAYLSTSLSQQWAMTDSYNGAQSFKFVAFDASGNLWVSGEHSTTTDNTDYIASYRPSDLLALGSNATPAPSFVVHQTASQASSSASFGALAFDGAGNLWLGTTSTELYRYPAANLTGSESGAADVVISDVPFLTYRSLAFDPIPTGLPIQ